MRYLNFWIPVVLLAVTACKTSSTPKDTEPVGCADMEAPLAELPGLAPWEQMCSVCHGETGGGGMAPGVLDYAGSEQSLATFIEQYMPPGNPERCAGDCAADVAAFVKSELGSDLLACDDVVPAPRQMRLLTRREYADTVRDVLRPHGSGVACSVASSCGLRERCEAGQCVAARCDEQVFVFEPNGVSPDVVSVAGSFNDWDPRAWPLRERPDGSWVSDRQMPPGEYQYKLVVDGSDWVADPRNPDGVDDGFGGQNSRLALACPGGAELGGDLPVETRPQGYLFDNNAKAGQVTATHLEAYFDAAQAVADDVSIDDLFVCETSDREACTRAFVETVGRRIFRRPLTDDEVFRYTALGMSAAGSEEGRRFALQALLSSPHFLYRSEAGGRLAEQRFALDPYELATSLSYFYWGTTPPDWLLDAAASGVLDDAEGVEQVSRTLLEDPRSRKQVEVFARQWLGAENALTVDKHADLFPEMTPSLRESMVSETEAFVSHVVFDGSGRFSELFDADYALVDDDLAPIYGVTPPGTQGLVEVPLERGGILGHASVASTTSHSDQTSPVRRGLFVRRNLLCQELPPPPPNGGNVPEVDPTGTTRDRFEQHSSDPACASCHQYIDGVGFGFEHLDPIGRYRATENGQTIDDSGVLRDVEGLGTGTERSFTGVVELGHLLAQSESAQACFVSQVYRFAYGRKEDVYSTCSLNDLQRQFDAHGGDIRELMIAVTSSPEFRLRRAP